MTMSSGTACWPLSWPNMTLRGSPCRQESSGQKIKDVIAKTCKSTSPPFAPAVKGETSRSKAMVRGRRKASKMMRVTLAKSQPTRNLELGDTTIESHLSNSLCKLFVGDLCLCDPRDPICVAELLPNLCFVLRLTVSTASPA